MEGNQKIIINISGQNFVTSRRTLLKYSSTRLGKLASANQTVLEFEGDTEIFREILKFYWSDKLHCPKNVCFDDFKGNLDFWEIDCEYIADCCAGDMNEETSLHNQFAYFDKKIKPEAGYKKLAVRRLQYRVWSFLDDPAGGDSGCRYIAAAWAVFYLIMTVITGVLYAYATVFWHQAEESYAMSNVSGESRDNKTEMCDRLIAKFNGVENAYYFICSYIGCGIFFGLEVWMRFISCPKKCEFLRSRHVCDLISSVFECYVVTFYGVLGHDLGKYDAGRFAGDEIDLIRRCYLADILDYFMLLVAQLRLTRLLSYASVYSGLKVLLITLYRSWKEIVLLVVLITLAVLIFAPIVYFLSQTEITAPNSIRDIPTAYWFVLVTMTTVGYGDIYPTELGGYMGTMIVMICGLMVTALPVAIIGGNFTVVYEYNEKYKKRQKRESMKDRSTVDSSQVEPLKVEDMA